MLAADRTVSNHCSTAASGGTALEELLGLLAEGGVDPRTMRGCWNRSTPTPSRYRRLGTALADALASDRSCERDLVLARSSLPAKLRAFLASRHAELCAWPLAAARGRS